MDVLIYVQQNTPPDQRKPLEDKIVAEFWEVPDPGRPDGWKSFKTEVSEFQQHLNRTRVPTF